MTACAADPWPKASKEKAVATIAVYDRRSGLARSTWARYPKPTRRPCPRQLTCLLCEVLGESSGHEPRAGLCHRRGLSPPRNTSRTCGDLWRIRVILASDWRGRGSSTSITPAVLGGVARRVQEIAAHASLKRMTRWLKQSGMPCSASALGGEDPLAVLSRRPKKRGVPEG